MIYNSEPVLLHDPLNEDIGTGTDIVDSPFLLVDNIRVQVQLVAVTDENRTLISFNLFFSSRIFLQKVLL